MESTTVLDTLQQHHPDVTQDYMPSSSKGHAFVYPMVLLIGCVLFLIWRKYASPKLSWGRRRLPVSRYEV